jgi:murein DD-endopeptidase MepM/ murein hydrolase activator NlpD
MKYFFRIIIFFLLSYISIANAASSVKLPISESVPGGIEILTFHIEPSMQPNAYFQGHQVFLLPNKNDRLWYALVGIPLTAKPQNYYVKIFLKDGSVINKKFSVNSKSYPAEYLKGNILSSGKEEAKTKSAIDEARTIWTNNIPESLTFNLPVEGKIFGDFGLQRFYNKKPRKPHNGVDIAAVLNSPVKAPLDGEVILTGNYNDTGNTIILNHGNGLLTLYAHLNKIFIEKGHYVKTGMIIGSVGQGGIISQPHLHWSVLLNGEFVNPKLFLLKRTT